MPAINHAASGTEDGVSGAAVQAGTDSGVLIPSSPPQTEANGEDAEAD